GARHRTRQGAAFVPGTGLTHVEVERQPRDDARRPRDLPCALERRRDVRQRVERRRVLADERARQRLALARHRFLEDLLDQLLLATLEADRRLVVELRLLARDLDRAVQAADLVDEPELLAAAARPHAAL